MFGRRSLLPLVALLGLGSAGLGTTAGVSVPRTELPLNLPSRVAALLPQPDAHAQLVKMGSQIATVNLQQRVTNVGGSPAALKTVLASVARGQMPSYDSRLGIKRAEFERYLAFQPVLLPTGKSLKLALLRNSQRVAILEMPGAARLLHGLSFDLKTGALQVPEGFIFQPSLLAASTAKDRSIDLRGGVQWDLLGYDPISQNGINGQLNLYQLGNGQVLLKYSRTNMVRGTPGEYAEVLLTYSN